MMPVSNARRIGFTAMALVAFWVLAWRAYGMAQDAVSSDALDFSGDDSWIAFFRANRQFITSISIALIPTTLLSLSVCNFPMNIRDRWMLTSAILFPATIAVCCGFGRSDTEALHSYYTHLQDTYGGIANGTDRIESSFMDGHKISRFWLLLPIILTTAFVIVGAWRSAVKAEEEVGVVGGDDE